MRDMASAIDIVELVENFNEKFEAFKLDYDNYVKRLAEITKYQSTGRKLVIHQRHEVAELTNLVKSDIENSRKVELIENLEDISIRLADMQEHFPCESNGLYLDIILGQINVSILNKLQRFRYKDDYEKFKLRVTMIMCIFAPLVCYLHMRTVDAVYNFFLVWYYCTLTIRERILKCNGSRIKGWWLLHHYVSTLLCGILLTWPDGQCYQNSRFRLLTLSFYMSFVQILQCQYQRGCLYRLRTLGQRHSMDITIEGFHSWMFRGLTFLLPFLVVGYIFQLYVAYVLYIESKQFSCPEWQVNALAIIFFAVAVGNSYTTGSACWQKVCLKAEQQRLQRKYQKIVCQESGDNNKEE